MRTNQDQRARKPKERTRGGEQSSKGEQCQTQNLAK